jgi:hypothetical protein
MRIAPCRTYHSKAAGTGLVRMPDGLSVFKIYYISIIGRDEPARYEWGKGSLAPREFEELLGASAFEGVGFITAFPHITKVFRFAPSMETVLHVQAFNTRELAPLSLAREDNYLEFACYAEAEIAAEEFNAWARASSVEEYLSHISRFDDGPIVDHAKLAAYWKP